MLRKSIASPLTIKSSTSNISWLYSFSILPENSPQLC